MPLALTGFALKRFPSKVAPRSHRVWLPFPLHMMNPFATAGVLTNGSVGNY
jgi:hypothetical protein